MAGNEWINGYLEAILDSRGGGAIEDSKAAAAAAAVNLRETVHFNPTKYFVEEVVTGVDETDLHRTWIKVVATRNSRERSSRLENMCWRIWHLARKKKQVPTSPSSPLFLTIVRFYLPFPLRFNGCLLLLSSSAKFQSLRKW